MNNKETNTENSPIFSPNGVITLTTDFGLSDPCVGIMKGVILSRYPQARLIDLSHHVPSFHPALAGFWLARAHRYFPAGTVHLAVVDPGVGTARKMVCLQAHQQVFVAPDNGLLSEVFSTDPAARWQVFALSDLRSLRLMDISNTFHGRDIFAPLVAEIAGGRLAPSAVGEALLPTVAAPRGSGVGQILWADHYGNLITDIPANELAHFRQPALQWRSQQIRMAATYGLAPVGSLLGDRPNPLHVRTVPNRSSEQRQIPIILGKADDMALARI